MIANIYGRKIDSGHYAVFRGHEQIGEVGRIGPEGTLAWKAIAGTWESPVFKSKHHAVESLVDHVVARNGNFGAAATVVADEEAYHPSLTDADRFTYLAWGEVKDRLALTRGLVLDMLYPGDVYATTPDQHTTLRLVSSALFTAHQAMRSHDGEGGY